MTEEELKRLGMRVRLFRTSAGISQRILGLRAGVNKLTILRIEHGTHPASISVFGSIAKALEIPLSELVDVDDDSPFLLPLRGRDSNPQPNGYQLQPKVA